MRFSLILRAVATSWVAILANAAVGFLLTPYVLHHLGDEAFGLWVLVVTLVGYYGLFDAGVRSSILRYASRHRARSEEHTSELQSHLNLVCRLLLEKKKNERID